MPPSYPAPFAPQGQGPMTAPGASAPPGVPQPPAQMPSQPPVAPRAYGPPAPPGGHYQALSGAPLQPMLPAPGAYRPARPAYGPPRSSVLHPQHHPSHYPAPQAPQPRMLHPGAPPGPYPVAIPGAHPLASPSTYPLASPFQQQAPPQQPASRWDPRLTHWILRTLATTGVLALSLLAALISLGGGWALDQARGTERPSLQILELLVALALVASLAVRRRAPLVLMVCSSLAGIILGLDTTVGLIASVTFLANRPPWRADRRQSALILGALALLAAGTGAAVHHDAMRAPLGMSILAIFVLPSVDGDPVRGEIGWSAQLVATVLIVSIPLIVGTVLAARRGEAQAAAQVADARAQRARAEHEAAQATRTTEALMDQVELREERERIAHEVHDGLGHRLSLLAMQAGLLERSADAATAQRARAVRQTSQEAMGELRSLLEVLRDPSGSAGQPAPRLEELAAVVDSMVEAGTPLNSSIVLDRPAQAGSVLSHAVYRIVQECLTNASKHSPGEPIRLRVEGSPETGIHLRCSNRLAPAEDRPEEPGSGTGLRGMAHRVQICGGRLRAGPSPEGEFIVEVDLPWLPGPSPQQ
ncbi:sensor histidine kinase [Actinomyces bowdenii]|uniref:histidine kinase n=1 Tax=Actinomyces bowdenii TaxID=131109 RepID=A0A3P1V6P7_9ACTO|nr:histidine kinase [Actinomyces bowdenii]RRD29160.1 two-component sensor histidine kinase [Actinomyces bowdenii]